MQAQQQDIILQAIKQEGKTANKKTGSMFLL